MPVDVSVEYSHIYTSQTFSVENAASIDMARMIAADLSAKQQTYQGVVMIDDYSPGGDNGFDYDLFLKRLAQKAAPRESAIIRESDLLAVNEQVLTAMRDRRLRRKLVRYIARHDGKHPCSLFIAAWYLVRLGILPDPTGRIDTAHNLINILPVRFEEQETAARKIILSVASQEILDRVLNIYMADAVAACEWDGFDPEAYLYANYATVHPSDLYMLNVLVDRYCQVRPEQVLEVGAGSCLFPILAALPFVQQVTVVEYGVANVEYLRRQRAGIDQVWQPYVQIIAALAGLSWQAEEFLQAYRDKVTIRQGSIFDLDEALYDAASMHYVAESIVDNREDFELACRAFIHSVRSGGLLIASFMADSTGYRVKDIDFPAFPVQLADLQAVFQGEPVLCDRVPTGLVPLREGNGAILYAVGHHT